MVNKMIKDELNSEYSQGMVLGKILTKVEGIEIGMRKVDGLESRLNQVEKDNIAIKSDLEQIKATLARPKAPWWSIASGLAGFASVVTLLLLILPRLLEQ